MADEQILTPETLRKLLRYEVETGKLFWRPRPADTKDNRIFNAVFSGKEAFTCVMPKGHKQGRIYRRAYLAHRVIWAMQKGAWPKGQIDHINGNPADNRIDNLRDIPGAENQRNMKMPKHNTSGVSGVSWRSNRGKWRARIVVGGKEKSLGHFYSFEKAVQAREEALKRYGYHENHGRTG